MSQETTVPADGDSRPAANGSEPSPSMIDVSLDLAKSPALLRLLEEVANADEPALNTTAYNRTHNRHNRHR